MTPDLTFACDCGRVSGTLHSASPRTGGLLQCHCADCRRAIIWLDRSDPGPDGVRYFQTTPDRISIERGADELRAFTWKNDKLLRWYAGCCHTPLLNTLNTPKWPFASLMVDRLSDASPLGPVKSHAFMPSQNGKTRNVNLLGFLSGFALRTARARLNGSWRNTPFFAADGEPIAPVRALTRDDRARATLT